MRAVKGFNFTACADDFLQIYADGKIMGHTRAINTSYTAVIPDGTKVLALKLVLLFLFYFMFIVLFFIFTWW